MTNSYRIETPYGVITRKSDHEYTHIVFSIAHPKSNRPCGTVTKKLGRTTSKITMFEPDTTQPKEPSYRRNGKIHDLAFCGSHALAVKAGQALVSAREWNGAKAEYSIYPATKVEGRVE